MSLPKLYQTTAFGLSGLVPVDMLSKLALPGHQPVDLVFLDTLYHFPETLDLVERVRQRYPVNVHVFKPEGCETAADFEAKHGQRLWESEGIYDYESKYTPGMTEYLCPAPLDEEIVSQLQAYALRAFKVLKLRGYARIDFILAKEQLWCLEANTLPGMTATSLLPKGANAVGIAFPELCERIVTSSLK